MAVKQVNVVLTQESEDCFVVQSWSNSSQLTVGQKITRHKLNKWVEMPKVNIRVVGWTPPTEDGQLDLFTKKEVKAIKAVIAAQ